MIGEAIPLCDLVGRQDKTLSIIEVRELSGAWGDRKRPQ